MTAADLLQQVATRFWRAMEFAMPSLPTDLRAALAWRVEDGDMRWALALMLAGWRLTDPREPKAGEVSQVLKQSGATSIIGQINLLRGIEGFLQFADRARDAESSAQQKAAAVALASAIERLDRMQLGLLIGMLRRTEMREVGQALIRRFPTPGSARPPVWGSPPTLDSATSRGEMFDRADYAPRDRALRHVRRRPMGGIIADESADPLPPISPPALDEHAVTVAFLHSLGHSEADIERLMAGPPKRST